MSGPPPGVKLSLEQIVAFKEAGVRAMFTANPGGSFGPFVMGYIFNLTLLGILFAQVWHWATWQHKERLFIRICVYWVTLFSVVSSSFVLCWFFHLFVTKYGFYAPFVDNTWFSWLPVIDQTIVAACQVFNLDRAYRIYGRKLWVILAVAPFILGTTSLIIARRAIASANGNPEFDAALMLRPYTQAYLFTNLVTDLLLTIIITWGLWRSKTGWKHTDGVIRKIITYTIKSQLLPTALAIAIAVQYAHNFQTLVVFLYMLCNSKVPAVMFMAVLNYRFELQVQKKVSAHQLSSDANLVPLGNGDSDIYKRNDVTDHTNVYPMLDRAQSYQSTLPNQVDSKA